MEPITKLGSVGIINPIIVILHSNFWKLYNKGKIDLDENNYVEEDDLEFIYNFDAYEKINKLNLGTTITHQNNLKELLKNRYNNSVKPFENIKKLIGEKFVINTKFDNQYMDLIFRFIYIYDKKYKNKENSIQEFLNHAVLSEF